MDKVFLPILLGTNREGRRSEKAAKFLLEEMHKRDDIETKLFDARDFKMPHDNYGEGIKDMFPEWRDDVTKSDGLIIVVPEYNHGYPGILKSILDTLYSEYANKTAGLVGVSSGGWGGTRVIENLIPIVYELGLRTSATINFPNMKSITDEELKNEDGAERVNAFLDKVVWTARALKWGRENL